MRTDIVALDVRGRWRSLLAYTAGTALYVLVVVALYPAFKDSTSLDSLVRSDATAAAVFGISGSISSSAGWLDANVYANFFPLIMLLMTVGYGAAALAGQDEDGTLCLLVTLPWTRASVCGQKVVALAIQAAVLAAAVALCTIVGWAFQISTGGGEIVGVSAAVLLMGFDFGVVTMAVGAVTGSRGAAIGTGSALAAGSYLISAMAPVVSWLHPARYVSLFYWSVGNGQLTSGVSAGDAAVLILVGVAAVWMALTAFRRADLR